MLLAESADHGLARRLHALDLERRILRYELGQRLAELRLGALADAFDGEAVHRLGQGGSAEAEVIAHAEIAGMENAVEVDLLDLRHRADVTGHERVHFGVGLALELEEVRNPHALLRIVHAGLAVGGDRALVNPEDAQLADVRVGGDLEHVRHVALGGIRLG